MSCLCLGEGKKGGTGMTHVIRHDKKFWKIKTKKEGKDYQEDDVIREKFYSYLISFSKSFLSSFCNGAIVVVWGGGGLQEWSHMLVFLEASFMLTHGQNVRL